MISLKERQLQFTIVDIPVKTVVFIIKEKLLWHLEYIMNDHSTGTFFKHLQQG